MNAISDERKEVIEKRLNYQNYRRLTKKKTIFGQNSGWVGGFDGACLY